MVTYFLGFIFFWLAILTFILLKTRAHYQHLVSATKKKKLDEILDQVVDNDGKFRREIDLITKELKKIEDNTNFYFQKAGLVHYNPFNGRGEQSFVLALLNKKNSGFILNFIYIPKYSFIASSYITVVGEILTTVIVVFILVKHFKYANRS